MKTQNEMQKQKISHEEQSNVLMTMELDDETLEQVTGGYILPNLASVKKSDKKA